MSLFCCLARAYTSGQLPQLPIAIRTESVGNFATKKRLKMIS